RLYQAVLRKVGVGRPRLATDRGIPELGPGIASRVEPDRLLERMNHAGVEEHPARGGIPERRRLERPAEAIVAAGGRRRGGPVRPEKSEIEVRGVAVRLDLAVPGDSDGRVRKVREDPRAPVQARTREMARCAVARARVDERLEAAHLGARQGPSDLVARVK